MPLRPTSLAVTRPFAITMWDFSWLERRWPGAGYEDWDQALGELRERGYDAVRIDAYPHLLLADKGRAPREWELIPCWNQQDWGSPARVKVRVQPSLNAFVRACANAGIRVALSSWYREESERHRNRLVTPQRLAEAWITTLDSLAAENLLGTLLYVDLCNEWPLPQWTPFFTNEEGRDPCDWSSPKALRWVTEASALVRQAYPQLPITFSTTTPRHDWYTPAMADSVDFFEHHIWMASYSDFYTRVGYSYDLFSSTSYENLARNGESMYREAKSHWDGQLVAAIQSVAALSRTLNRPMVTTECWGPVDYKDWPHFDWGWVKELCELGTLTACSTGRWAGMATSNFCGPQFRGMWRDVSWHRRLTDAIHASTAPSP
ncbi:cellulase-like family protein [Nibricoccus sp. IMCC34717]|uniref:cellulase-like family protein n=1 Tax=Nibricoccus sp. IMCC34717 TaxID=3034021 RepID=UPI00384C0FD5